jgi:phosphatidylglycerol:prolipoprotein diacylglycerol transferase
MVFAKLPYLFLDWGRFVSGQAWFDNGKTITLGLMGGYFGVEGMKWAMRIPYKTGDGFAVPVAVSIAIGRFSCFAAGCCYGIPTDLPWGMRFHDSLLRHPTQLYEVMFHLTMAAGMWHMLQYRMLTGNLIKFYFVSYYCYRFLTEFIRPEPRILFGLTFYQYASLVGIALFGTLWYLDQKKMSAFLQHEARMREALD